MTPSESELIAALVAAQGEVPPLWARYPRVHPLDIHWRMGAGESYKSLFNCWEAGRSWSETERIAYVERWDPPYSWLEWAAWFIWPDDFSDPERAVAPERWEQLAAHGLGERADWERCLNVEPDEYPLDEDTSSRWLAASDA